MTQEKLILRALSFIIKLLWNIFVDMRGGKVPLALLQEGELIDQDLQAYFKTTASLVKPS